MLVIYFSTTTGGMAFLRHISGENLGELVCTDTGREGLYNSKFGKLMQPVMMAITLSA